MPRPSAMRASVTRISRYSHGALVNSGCEFEEIHDPQVGRNARQQLIEHRARHVAALRQRPDRFEAGAEIRRRGADRGRLHQRMAGGAVFAGPFARRLTLAPGSALGSVPRPRAASAPGAFRATRTASGGRNFARPPARRPRSAPSIRKSRQRRPAISAADLYSSSGPSPAQTQLRDLQPLLAVPCYMVAKSPSHNPPALFTRRSFLPE